MSKPRPLPTRDHKSGELYIVLAWAPDKRCPACGMLRNPVDFLKTFSIVKGTCYLREGRTCLCQPPDPFPIHCDARGNLSMRLVSLVDERGEPYRWRDRKEGKQEGPWRSVSNLRLRRMGRGSNMLRDQPRKDRGKPKLSTRQRTATKLFEFLGSSTVNHKER